MLKIALDFDNVLADTTGAWIRCYNKMYNKTLKKSDINEYYFWDSLNISRDEAFKIFSMVWNAWRDLPLLGKDTVMLVNSIANMAEVDLVSSALVDMKDWIDDKNLIFNKVVYTQHKSPLNYDIFIEDSPYEALKIVDNKRICLLYDQPWNKITNTSDKLIRIKHLEQATHIINDCVKLLK